MTRKFVVEIKNSLSVKTDLGEPFMDAELGIQYHGVGYDGLLDIEDAQLSVLERLRALGEARAAKP